MGCSVYGSDHRGHGKSASGQQLGHMPSQNDLDGWQASLTDAADYSQWIRQEHKALPLFIFGHSMGSILVQQLILSQTYQGAILSASPGFLARPLLYLLSWLAAFESWRLGESGASKLLHKLIFANSNKSFKVPQANGFEWLSRDVQAVQEYLQDSKCGFVLRAGSLLAMFRGNLLVSSQAAVQSVPSTLPIYIFSGADDPLHHHQKTLRRMLNCYQAQSLNITIKIYSGARHAPLCETNKETVYNSP